ncbi:MAG TPA: aldo/keto reductase [Bacteroidales bacterium]|jgi:predicted aldo/keto reductase-like oxidoreductase|nr:aldo/keto reductase [Bacteroidales bacterium]
MKRRQFLENAALGSLALGLTSFDTKKSSAHDSVPKRKLGKTGEQLSIIGFGGIMLNDNTQEFANEMVTRAFNAGINYYDVAPSYGNALPKLGPALKSYRKDCFLACKTMERGAQGAEKELNESLRALLTDHFDLYQLHALSSTDEVEKAFGAGGAMEVFVKAREQGKIRFLGFSAHNEEAALLAMSKFDFDTILYPINFNCWMHGDFGPRAFEMAKSKGMGILALKAMAMTPIKPGEPKHYKNVWYRPVEDDEMAGLALRYTLSKEVTAAIPPGDAQFFWKALEIIKDLKPITLTEIDKLNAFVSGNPPIFTANA